jgi:hypothetical protein
MLIHEMGTLDHAVALMNQFLNAGGQIDYCTLDNSELPDWADQLFSSCNKIALRAALDCIDSYSGVWFQEPYDELRPVAIKEATIDSKNIYSGYGVPLTNWVHGNYQLEFFQRCHLICASSQFAKSMYENSGFPPKNVEWTGDPLLYSIFSSPSIAVTDKKKFLWAPHWTQKWVDGSRGFSNWKESVGLLIAFFKANTDYSLIVRGHPHLETKGIEDEHYASQFEDLLSLKNVSLSHASLENDIRECMGMLSDGVSILAYFGITGKRMATFVSGDFVPPFNAAGLAIFNCMEKVFDLNSLEKWFKDVSSTVEPNENLRNLILQLFPFRNESPGEHLHKVL